MNVAEFRELPQDAELHLNRAINSASVQASPFPHVFLRDVFPPSCYDLMRRNFPDSGSMISNGRAGRGNQLQARFVFELKPQYLSTLPGRQREFWTDFANWFLGEKLRSVILDKFAKTVTQRFADRDEIDFWSDGVLVEDQTTHSMGPHTDHPRKAVTLLFYLPGDESQAHLGTSIYLPKERTVECSGLAHHPFEKFDRVATFPFVPNALLIFAKTNNSFHGIEPVNDVNCRRWLLMLNINVREPGAAKQ